jgi:hypothetical protein
MGQVQRRIATASASASSGSLFVIDSHRAGIEAIEL